jgi:hypothetical protein
MQCPDCLVLSQKHPSGPVTSASPTNHTAATTHGALHVIGNLLHTVTRLTLPPCSDPAPHPPRTPLPPPHTHTQVQAAVQSPVNVSELRAAKQEVSELIQSKYCNPILIRLGWHDAGTFDKVRDSACGLSKRTFVTQLSSRQLLTEPGATESSTKKRCTHHMCMSAAVSAE